MVANSKHRPRPDVALMELIIKLKHCCEDNEARVRERAALSPAEYACLREMPASGSVDAGTLSERMGLSASRGSRVSERMVKRGFLERRTSEQDRRVAQLQLTRSGRAVKRSVENYLAGCGAVLRERLSKEQLGTALTGLSLVLSALEETEDTSSAGSRR